MWNAIVKTYSKCALKIPNDNLVTLSGLARLHQDMTGDEYLAGLWRSQLSQFDYRAPSWSWASLDGSVHPSGISPDDIQLLIINEAQITCSTLDHTGKVSSEFITVEGLLVQATYHGTGERGFACRLKPVAAEIPAHVWEDALSTNFVDGMELHCLALKCYPIYSEDLCCGYHLVGLLLEPVPGLARNYKRIGYFTIADKDNIEKFGISVNKEERSVAQFKADQLSTIKIL